MSENLLADSPAEESARESESVHFYQQADEIVFGRHSGMNPSKLANLCREARSLFRSLAIPAGRHAARLLAARLGVRIAEEEWQAAEGKVIFFAECEIDSGVITINRAARRRLEEALPLLSRGNLREWALPELATESAIAHELYHVLTRQSSGPAVELAAHCFARELVGLPFSPLLFGEILKPHAGIPRPRLRQSPNGTSESASESKSLSASPTHNSARLTALTAAPSSATALAIVRRAHLQCAERSSEA